MRGYFLQRFMRYNLVGKKFGKLTVVKMISDDIIGNKSVWLCHCDCGKRRELTKFRLCYGGTVSCGCARVGNGVKEKPLEHKLFSKIIKDNTSECWEFKIRHTNGYGQIHHSGKCLLAHRVSWQIHNGEIPEGMFVCHTCDNPPCVNPDHLFLGTHSDNMIDMYVKGRGAKRKRNASSKCKNGHDRIPENLYTRPDNGIQACLICIKIASKKHEDKQTIIRRERSVRTTKVKGSETSRRD